MKAKTIILSIALLIKAIEAFDEDSEEEWIFRMQHVLSKSLSSIHGQNVKFGQLGIAGGAVVDVWLNQHCSMKNGTEGKVMDCMSCFHRHYQNISGIANCTRTYLPDDYHSCVNYENVSSTFEHYVFGRWKQPTVSL